MDMNDRVMQPADYTEMLEKIRQMDILAMKESVAEQFAELNVTAEQVETLVKNLFIKQVLVIEDHERRQKEGFTKRDVMEACLEVTANEVLDFITAHAELGESSSEVTALILERLAPGAKVSEEELDIPVFVHRPAVVSMDELQGPNGAEALRRASEQATINGLLEAGAVPINIGTMDGAQASTAASEAVNITIEFSNQPSKAENEGEVKMVNAICGGSLSAAKVAFQKSCDHEAVVKVERENRVIVAGNPAFNILAKAGLRLGSLQ